MDEAHLEVLAPSTGALGHGWGRLGHGWGTVSYGIRFRSRLRRMNIPSAPLFTTMMPLSKYG